MKSKSLMKILAVLLALGMLISYVPVNVSAENAVPQQVVTVDNAVLDEINKNGVATYWVDFKNSADLSQAYFMDWSARGWYVYETLKAQAEKTQSLAIAYLENTGLTYKSYWIANRILVERSDKTVLSSLKQLPNVVSISAQQQYILYEPEQELTVEEPKGIEPNLTHVKAPDAWALGYDGTGLVVANIDTGVRYSHQALVGQYRGNNGGTFDHNYNWLNPDNLGDNVPRDGHGHGTHTMGTMVGDDGGSNQIGIAPGAEWMACAGCPNGSCTDTALLGCAEFVAAPTNLSGNNPNPDMRPNVVNNSWGDCGQTYDPWFEDVISAWHAVGTYPVFSNGNASNCSYSSPPGLNTVGNPARSGNVTGVGSSGEQNGLYANHSNWGPTDNLDTVNPVDGFAMMKPQVLAPGVSIRSSVPTNDSSYEDGWTGTSMSAPHVTGLVAMMMQAAPCLVGDYATIELLIESTAVDMTYNDGSALTPTDFPNFATGWGEIDALAAVQLASGMCGNSVLYGTVTSDSAEPVSGAKVEITGTNPANNRTVYTNAAGQYTANVNADTFNLVVSAFGFEGDTATGVVVADGASVMQDFVLAELPNTLVTGVVYDDGILDGAAHGYPLYAKLTFSMTGFSESVYTDPFTGEYEIVLYNSQEYDVNIQALVPGYQVLETTITADDVAVFEQDYYLNIDSVACSAPGYQPEYDLIYNFESGEQGFVSSGANSSWARGIPTNGPGEAHSGSYVIATNPTGNYNANELSYMTSPVIDLTGFGTDTPVIEFWQWRHIESASYDNGTVEVTKNGGTTWTAVYGPMGGVTDTAYNKVTFALDPTYNVANFQLRFKFKSDGSVMYEGWYVDDIGIASAPVPPPTQVYTQNFDTDNGGFVVSGTNPSWAWGAPTSGPAAAHSAPNVWATNLTGIYNASEQSYITSPVIDLSAYVGLAPTLSFWHWMDSESNTWDWGAVEVTKDGGASWQNVFEKFGDILTWSPKSIALDASYAVANFQFRFFMRSDSSGQYPGWYIDDVVVSVSEPYTIAVPCGTIPGGVVAGYVYDGMVEDTKLYGATVESEQASALTEAHPESPVADGIYWLFQPFLDYAVASTPRADIQDLAGSFIEFDPTAGGDADYTPGEPGTFCFRAETFTSDWEWAYADWLKFPSDWTVTNIAKVGTATCTGGGSVAALTWTFETNPYEVKVSMTRQHANPADHCTAYYCVSAIPGEGVANAKASWYFDGDGWGDIPNHPCSSDNYTPGSMSGEPCDQATKPQASIPRGSYSEPIEFTASLQKYETVTEPVNVKIDSVVRKDWELGAGLVVADPLALERTIALYDDPEITTLDLSNLGPVDAAFSISEKNIGFQPYSIPAFKGREILNSEPASMFRDPNSAATVGSLELNALSGRYGITAAPPAYGIDLLTDQLYFWPDASVPGTSTLVGTPAATSLFAGDFMGGDFSTLYAVSYDNNNLYAIDTATGVATLVGATNPPTGTFGGLAGGPGVMYGVTTECNTASTLVELDVTSGATTTIGTLTNATCLIDLAYVPDTGMLYGVDLVSNSLHRIDPATGMDTVVGDLGADPNYAQGMDYDEENHILYWAAYTTTPELRIIDINTGASALVGAFTQGEVDAFAIAAGGGGGAVPWLDEDPVEGTVPGMGTYEVEIEFSVDGIEQPGDYFAQLEIRTDTPYKVDPIPVTLHVIRPLNYGNIKGNVFAYEQCDLNPAPLEDALVNFYLNGQLVHSTLTDDMGYFTYALINGTYDVEITKEGYVSQLISDVVLGWDTNVMLDDTTLRLNVSCLSVDPESFYQELNPDGTATQTMTLTNTGALEAPFEITERPGAGPVPYSKAWDVELVLDDGVAEDAIGIGGTAEFIVINRFTPAEDQFPFTLEQVDISFEASGSVAAGDPFRIVVYQNTTGSVDPAPGSEFLYQQDEVVGDVTGWNSYVLDEPVMFAGPGDVLIGAIFLKVPGSAYFPASIDQTASQERSWAGWWSSEVPAEPVLPPDDSWILIDSVAGLAGNWTIRGMGSAGSTDIVWLTEDPTAGVVDPDGGSVDVTLTFDATDLTWGDYFGSLRVNSPTEATMNVPVQLRLLAPADYGFAQGNVFVLEVCNVNPAPASKAVVKFLQEGVVLYSILTDSDGYYSTAIPEGTYDIEVAIDGYETTTFNGLVISAGDTTVQDLTLRLMAPCLQVAPAALEKSLLPDTTGTQVLKLTNIGAAEGVFELFEVPVAGVQAEQIVLDPSFEEYSPNPYWDDYSETYGTVLCNEADCGVGGGSGPNTGEVWTWFGGATAGDYGYVSQDVVIDPGTAMMTFWAEQAVCGDGGASNYMALLIDETEIWRTDGLDAACGTIGYRMIELDVSEFADGSSHAILFESVTVGSGNFFLDDVEIQLEAGGDVLWLSEDPTAGVVPAGASVDVTIIYDATGLALGDYLATLRVKNAPAPNINVPVTLHVVDEIPVFYIYLPLLLK